MRFTRAVLSVTAAAATTAVTALGLGLGLGAQPVGSVLPATQPAAAQVAAAAATTTYSASRCGNTSGRVLLTFDDWAYGDPYRATRTGAYLQSRGIRALFFLINQEARRYPGIVTTLRQQGHYVLNHTYSHPDLTTLSSSSIAWQIRNGITSNRLRPPYGSYNSRVASVASQLGYRLCTWTIDTRDWEYVNGRRRSVSSIRYLVRSSSYSAKSSGVVLGHLHTNYPDAVAGIIYDLRQQGFLFCRNRGQVKVNVTFPLACT